MVGKEKFLPSVAKECTSSLVVITMTETISCEALVGRIHIVERNLLHVVFPIVGYK
jgi:hypothetical protein